jgi:hypothetical protein
VSPPTPQVQRVERTPPSSCPRSPWVTTHGATAETIGERAGVSPFHHVGGTQLVSSSTPNASTGVPGVHPPFDLRGYLE